MWIRFFESKREAYRSSTGDLPSTSARAAPRAYYFDCTDRRSSKTLLHSTNSYVRSTFMKEPTLLILTHRNASLYFANSSQFADVHSIIHLPPTGATCERSSCTSAAHATCSPAGGVIGLYSGATGDGAPCAKESNAKLVSSAALSWTTACRPCTFHKCPGRF